MSSGMAPDKLRVTQARIMGLSGKGLLESTTIVGYNQNTEILKEDLPPIPPQYQKSVIRNPCLQEKSPEMLHISENSYKEIANENKKRVIKDEFSRPKNLKEPVNHQHSPSFYQNSPNFHNDHGLYIPQGPPLKRPSLQLAPTNVEDTYGGPKVNTLCRVNCLNVQQNAPNVQKNYGPQKFQESPPNVPSFRVTDPNSQNTYRSPIVHKTRVITPSFQPNHANVNNNYQ